MATKELKKLENPQNAMSHAAVTMAVGIVVERIRRLSAEDRSDLYELMKDFAQAKTREDFESITTAMTEILDQDCGHVLPLEMDEEQPGAGLQKWLDFVSKRIRTLREDARLTQEELADKSSLPQSHISRLENAKHSPSRVTLEKIAAALGVPVSQFDPSA